MGPPLDFSSLDNNRSRTWVGESPPNAPDLSWIVHRWVDSLRDNDRDIQSSSSQKSQYIGSIRKADRNIGPHLLDYLA